MLGEVAGLVEAELMIDLDSREEGGLLKSVDVVEVESWRTRRGKVAREAGSLAKGTSCG